MHTYMYFFFAFYFSRCFLKTDISNTEKRTEGVFPTVPECIRKAAELTRLCFDT